jgi:hypothetical protein
MALDISLGCTCHGIFSAKTHSFLPTLQEIPSLIFHLCTTITRLLLKAQLPDQNQSNAMIPPRCQPIMLNGAQTCEAMVCGSAAPTIYRLLSQLVQYLISKSLQKLASTELGAADI